MHQPLIHSFLKGGSHARNQIHLISTYQLQTTLSPPYLFPAQTHTAMATITQRLRAWFPRMAHDHQSSASSGGAYHHRWTLTRVLRGYAGDWALVVGLWCVLLSTCYHFWIHAHGSRSLFFCPLPLLVLTSFAARSLRSLARILLELLNQIGGHKREFSLTDITIQRPFKSEHVPPALLFVISLAVPLVFLVGVGAGVYQSRWDVHNGVLGELLVFGMWSK